MKKNLLPGLIILLCAVVLAGCAAGPNPAVDTPNNVNHIAGFWRGLWHGIILPITWFISLFTDKVHIYEVHNNGGWYNFGFFLGIGSLGGGASSSTRKRKH